MKFILAGTFILELNLKPYFLGLYVYDRNLAKMDHHEMEKLNHELAIRQTMKRYIQLALIVLSDVLVNYSLGI